MKARTNARLDARLGACLLALLLSAYALSAQVPQLTCCPTAAAAGGGMTSLLGATLDKTSHTANTSLSVLSSFTLHDNDGATGEVILTLPQATSAGTVFFFTVAAAHSLQVKASNVGDVINLGNSQSASGGYVRSNGIGSTLLIVSGVDQWFVMSHEGTWTVDS